MGFGRGGVDFLLMMMHEFGVCDRWTSRQHSNVDGLQITMQTNRSEPGHVPMYLSAASAEAEGEGLRPFQSLLLLLLLASSSNCR